MIAVEVAPEARAELEAMPTRERFAMNSALDKLRELGDALGYPHSNVAKHASGRLAVARVSSWLHRLG